MKFTVIYQVGHDGITIPNKVNPIEAKDMKHLLQAIAANIQCGADLELPIVGIHITPAE